MPMTGNSPIGLDFVTKLKDVYSILHKDEQERLMAEIHSLIEFSMERRNPIHRVLERVSRLIVKNFEFKSVSVGIRGEGNMYRYVAFAGHPKEAEDALRLQKYDLSDMLDYDKFPNIRIGATAQYNPVEGFPDKKDELMGHRIPELPKSPRKNLNEFVPGDYIAIYMYGFEGKLIGWIELSDTNDGRLPSRKSIRWIEMIGDICAAIIQLRMRSEKEDIR